MLILESHNRLGLLYDEHMTRNNIRQAYFKKSLLYHPDKNITEDTQAKFQEINDAYEEVMKYHGFMDDDNLDIDAEEESDIPVVNIPSFATTLLSFFQTTHFHDIKKKVLHTIVESISNKCEDDAHELMSKMNNTQYRKICSVMRNYKDTVHIPEQFIDGLEKKLDERLDKNTTIVIKPTIQDLVSNNLYKLNENGKQYLIPVWNHELIYENGDSELCVQCVPEIDENVEIDINNDIHIKKEYLIGDLWKTDTITVDIGDKQCIIQRNRLKMTERQTIRFAKMGISRMNPNNVYDISRKSDIFVNIHII